MSGWKLPAIPDINEKTVLAALSAIKEIIEMREGMRTSKNAVGFVKVATISECPDGLNCIDNSGNVLIRGDLTVLGSLYPGDIDIPEPDGDRATIVGDYDIYVQTVLGGSYKIYAGKAVQGVYDVLVQAGIQGVYDIELIRDAWGDGDAWSDGDLWFGDF